jgi:hypothetical protein
MPDDQDRAEALDDDKIGGEYPPERPLGTHRRQDDAVPGSFAGREARTEPEVDEPRRRVDENVPVDGRRVTLEDEIADTPDAAEEAALHLQETERG